MNARSKIVVRLNVRCTCAKLRTTAIMDGVEISQKPNYTYINICQFIEHAPLSRCVQFVLRELLTPFLYFIDLGVNTLTLDNVSGVLN